MIDGTALIDAQFSVCEPTPYDLGDGHSTLLAPGATTPMLADPACRLDLAGKWAVTRWPFRGKEAKLAGPSTSTARWSTVEQPGPVFLCDPEERTSEVKDWNRVTLSLLDPEDGAILRKQIVIPKAWRGKRVRLRFDAVYPAARFYLNGTLRTLMGGGGRYMSMMREYRDVPVRCRPGRSATLHLPIWNPSTLQSLEAGNEALCRCVVLDPRGFRPIMHDIVILPETMAGGESAMPIGPDAVAL